MKKKRNNLPLQYHLDARLTSRVKIFPSKKTFENRDTRRVITGIVGNFKFPFPIQQIKLIEFSSKAVREQIVVGNHRHLKTSGQWEIVLVLGGKKKSPFRFRYKNRNNEKIYERKLYGGDVVVIPPGCTLAFVAIVKGACMLEISNQEYNSANYIKDRLF